MTKETLWLIGGHLAFPLVGDDGRFSGVGLVSRAKVSAQYTLNNGSNESLNGTIGLPETQAKTSSGFNIVDPGNRIWCLPPRMEETAFYSRSAPRTVNISGNWVIVANGNQAEKQFTVFPMYAGSFSAISSGDRFENILPSNLTLRISTLECTVNTPTAISFGKVTRNTVVNSELAGMMVPLVVSCGQPSNYINANINVQFRAVSGLYNSMPSRLALNQGGGFITGEIDGGITGSGMCSWSTGLSFDGQPIKLGAITSQDAQKVFNHQLTWRLCSGGTTLPRGKVSATTEMLVTFN